MTFTRAQIAELDLVAAWLASEGVVAPEDVIVRLVKEVVKKTKYHMDERSQWIGNYPAYFAATLSKGGSASAPSRDATKAEKDAADIRRRTQDLKRFEHLCLELADYGDGRVIAAARQLEEASVPVTADAIREMIPPLLPPPEEGDPDKRFKLKREQRSDKHKSTLKPLGDAIEEQAA